MNLYGLCAAFAIGVVVGFFSRSVPAAPAPDERQDIDLDEEEAPLCQGEPPPEGGDFLDVSSCRT